MGRLIESGVQLSISRIDDFLRNIPFECRFKLSCANFSILHSFMIGSVGGSLVGIAFVTFGKLAYGCENCC